jgi:hypothetical protein
VFVPPSNICPGVIAGRFVSPARTGAPHVSSIAPITQQQDHDRREALAGCFFDWDFVFIGFPVAA